MPEAGVAAAPAPPPTGSPPTGAHYGPTATEARLDALMPAEMAGKAAEIRVRKAALGVVPTFVLAMLAGAFIALGAAFATTVSAGASGMLPYGVIRLLAGLAFSLGLILVIVGGPCGRPRRGSPTSRTGWILPPAPYRPRIAPPQGRLPGAGIGRPSSERTMPGLAVANRAAPSKGRAVGRDRSRR